MAKFVVVPAKIIEGLLSRLGNHRLVKHFKANEDRYRTALVTARTKLDKEGKPYRGGDMKKNLKGKVAMPMTLYENMLKETKTTGPKTERYTTPDAPRISPDTRMMRYETAAENKRENERRMARNNLKIGAPVRDGRRLRQPIRDSTGFKHGYRELDDRNKWSK